MKQSRQTKTPRQRAEEALGVAERLVKRLQAKHDALTAEAEALEPLLGRVDLGRDYLAANPDLPPVAQTDEVP